MSNYARIVGGVAVDVSSDPAEQFHPDIAAEFVKVPDKVRVHWHLVDGTWTAPQNLPGPPPVTWKDADPKYWWIDVGPFLDRFGAKALAITSSPDAEVRGLLVLLTPRAYVDLKRPDLPMLMDTLVTKGLLSLEDVNRILTTPTTDYERHIKGMPQPEAA